LALWPARQAIDVISGGAVPFAACFVPRRLPQDEGQIGFVARDSRYITAGYPTAWRSTPLRHARAA